jgi:hypothetical protein
MHLAVVLGVMVIAQDTKPVVDAEQFLRLIQGLQADYQDVSLVYEGSLTDLASVLGVEVSETVTTSYQGHFAYRVDGSFLRDSYTRHLVDNDDGTIFRSTIAALDDRMTRVDYTLDDREKKPREGEAAPQLLGEAMSPGRFLWIWYFQMLEDPAGLNYEFQGWEEVDGRSCLRVELDRSRGSSRRKYRFWIDVERGGHPLRVDQVWDGEVVLRTDGIRLELLSADDGKELWFPVMGRTQQFVRRDGTGEMSRSPTMRDQCSIASGTVRINAGLGDKVFSVDWEGLSSTPELDDLRSKAEVPAEPRRFDAESVREDLDRMLAEADAQSERLVASAQPPWWRRPGTLAPIGFAILGVVLLVGAAIRKGVAG